MKNKFLAACAIAAMFFAGCTDLEPEKQPKPVESPNGLTVGAGASYAHDDLQTKTIYPGIVHQNPDGSKIERINWIMGDEGYKLGSWVPDEITIYSNLATNNENKHIAEYVLRSHTAGNPKISSLPDDAAAGGFVGGSTPNGYNEEEGDNGKFVAKTSGLSWTDPEQLPFFFAVYPSNSLNESSKFTNVGNESFFEGKIASYQNVVGFIQEPKSKENPSTHNTYIAMPIMRQNYMWAGHKSTKEEILAQNINFQFKTICTVLEVDLVWPQHTINTEYALTSVMLTSATHDICGQFKVNLTNAGTTGKPVIENIGIPDGTTSAKSIIVNLDPAGTGSSSTGLVLKEGEHLKVRFILLPHENLTGDDLTLTINGPMGSRSHKLPADFKLQQHKINRIQNITLPQLGGTNNWISLMDDDVILSQMSIPGTGSSYQHAQLVDGKVEKGKENTIAQVLSVEEQWDFGIRCFDITTRKNADFNSSNFGQNVLVIDNDDNNNITNVNVDQVFETLMRKVKETNPDDVLPKDWSGEFGMLIIRFQPGDRKPGFIDDYEQYYNDILKPKYRNRFCVFKPGLTIKEARGKVMVILLPTSEGEDEVANLNSYSNRDYLIVDGNGSLPDKFYRRGYWITPKGKPEVQVSPLCPVTAGSQAEKDKSVEYYIVNPTLGTYMVHQENINFSYPTNASYDAYMQDWTRVIDGEITGNGKATSNNSKHNDLKWQSSIDEKISNVQNTFLTAVENKGNRSTVYFNSLCGYLINNTNKTEYNIWPLYDGWGKISGDIKALADRINPVFYQFIVDKLAAGEVKGPMGVVLMNFVGDQTHKGNMLLTRMIIANNFAFPLLKGTPGIPEVKPEPADPMPESQGSYDASGWLWGK